MEIRKASWMQRIQFRIELNPEKLRVANLPD